MFYILHGEDEFTRSEELAKLKAQAMVEGMGDLNISVLDGRRIGLPELANSCNTVPFMSDRRLVIVEDFLQRFEPRRRSRDDQEAEPAPAEEGPVEGQKLLQYLPHLPPFARLVFVERKTLSRTNPVLKYAQQDGKGYVRLFATPEMGTLQGWVQQRVRLKGMRTSQMGEARISRDAAELLVSSVGNDLRLLDNELEKLVAAADYTQPVTAALVRSLVSVSQETDIFALVDSLGLRNRKQALSQLHALLADQANELYLLTMVARQFRLILSVKDLQEEQGWPAQQIRKELGITHDFIVEKLVRQARMFRSEELEQIQRRILELDQGIKTGRIEGPLGLDLLVLEICGQEEGRVVGTLPAGNHQARNRSRTRLARASSSSSPAARSR